MKNFANCNPDDFMAQVVKFRAPFVEWVKEIGIPEIRARRPEGFEKLNEKEKEETVSKLAIENIGEILTVALEKNAEATKEVMCLATFTDPNDFNNHTMVEYISAIMEMLRSKEVRGFFTFYLSQTHKTSSNA